VVGRPRPGLLGRLVRRMRKKEWHYVSAVTRECFLGVAVAQLGYVANVFAYFVDRETATMVETEVLSPLGLGVKIAGSSVDGATTWGGQSVSLAWHGGGWDCALALRLARRPLNATLRVEADRAVALLYPLGSNRAAYTHKEAGNRCSGTLEYGGRRYSLDGHAAMDWTRSFANRRTEWNWLCLAGTSTDGRRVGVNASARVYGDAENFAWVDGAPLALGEVRFEVPPDPLKPWKISGERIALEFTPLGQRAQNTNLGLVTSRFTQPFGTARGELRLPDGIVPLRDIFGVVEDHLAVW